MAVTICVLAAHFTKTKKEKKYNSFCGDYTRTKNIFIFCQILVNIPAKFYINKISINIFIFIFLENSL